MTRTLRIIVVALLCGLVGSAVGQGVVYVNGITGNDDWDGRCEVWDGGICGPKATIQDGIDTAVAGDQVLIADGIYTGLGNRDLDFRGQPITVRSASGNPATCIIDCERLGRGFVFQTGETASSVIDGLTIRNGFSAQGSGVYCSQCSPTLTNCAITDNLADWGAGVFCFGPGPTMINCQISRNVSSLLGGGIVCYWALDPPDARLVNCSIVGNVSGGSGGGLYCSDYSPTLTNCTIAGNLSGAADGSGGAIYCDFARPALTNCIVWANIPDQFGIGMVDQGPTLSYCDVQGGWTGEGNIDVDPGFAFPDDGHLLPGSPCIDAGTNDPPDSLPAYDLDRRPRAMDGDGDGKRTADMGTYEFNPAAPAIAVSDTELLFVVSPGQRASRTLSVANAGLGLLTWELVWQAEWLSASPVAGESEGETDLITLAVDSGMLPHGRYEDILWVTDSQADNSPRAVCIVLCVTGQLHVPAEHPTIQAAIDAALPGDEVIIADGLYTGVGNRDLDFDGKAITVRSASGDPAACVIDCGRQARGFFFHSLEGAGSIVQGLTIQNGFADYGGGLQCERSSPTLNRCRIIGNTAELGGGVCCFSSVPTLTDCTITHNQACAWGGGGLFLSFSDVNATNCAISHNTGEAGGAVYCDRSNPALTDCTMVGNAADREGGALFIWASYTSTPRLTNCTVFANTAGQAGGGVHCIDNEPSLINCILWANAPEQIYFGAGGGPTLSHCDVQGGWPGAGNIDVDPSFAFDEDVHLLPDSPCIDAGVSDLPAELPAVDIEGQPRSIDGDGDEQTLPDMGAYEFNPAVPAIALSATEVTFFVRDGQSASQTLGIRNSSLGVLAWQLHSQADWLTGQPAAGESDGEIDSITLTLDTQPLSHGRHDTVLQVTAPEASNSPRAVTVTLYVNRTLNVPGEYATIQAAIDAAVPGDEVVLADGVYTGPGNRDLDFCGKSINLHSASGEPTTCVIDCERQGRGFYLHTGETASARIDGITVRGGYTDDGGGGVFLEFSSPTLSNCIISENAARAYGGGVYCSACDPTLIDCTIKANVAGDYAGGVLCGNDAKLWNCVISHNVARNEGGGLYCYGEPLVTNCTIFGNTAGTSGGGTYCDGSPVITNCILWGDTPEEIYGGDSSPVVTYSDVQGGWPGTGNINIDPQFALPDDFHLLPHSPCLDAGADDVDGGWPTEDLDGQPRPIDADGDGHAAADIGAYEFNPASPAIACSPAELIFFVPPGQSSARPLTIRNSSFGTLTWELHGMPDWLSADRASGQSDGEADQTNVTADTRSLAPGRYQAVLWVTDPQASNSPRAVSVVLHATRTLNVPAEYSTIQAAIDAAITGDEVVLADGVYTGPGNRMLDFRGKPITVRSATDDPTACTIDCEQQEWAFRFHNGETATSVVRGLTLRNAREDYRGGAVVCSDSSPTLVNCIITGNSAGEGAGITCIEAAPTLINCILTGNTVTGDYGGGTVYCLNASPILRDCLIAGNASAGEGGAMFCLESSPTLINCAIVNNTAATYGGGLACWWRCNPVLIGCTITGNTAGDGGGGLYCDGESTATLTNCILWANAPQQIYVWTSPLITYCDVQGGWTGTGNIDADPLFADPDGPDDDPSTWEDNDYRLTAGSPCIDAGDPAFIPLPDALDRDGHAPLWDGDGDGLRRIDLGAYEYGSHAYGDLNCDGQINAFDIDPFVVALISGPDFAAYEASYDGCDALLADLNRDGAVNVFDIDAFILRLTKRDTTPS